MKSRTTKSWVEYEHRAMHSSVTRCSQQYYGRVRKTTKPTDARLHRMSPSQRESSKQSGVAEQEQGLGRAAEPRRRIAAVQSHLLTLMHEANWLHATTRPGE